MKPLSLLPKPIITYVLCPCGQESCKRMPVLGTHDFPAVLALRALRKAA